MKTLMMTTALVTATAFGAAAQTDTMATNGASQETVPAFLSSDFTGMTLYTLDTDAVGDMDTTERSASERDRMRWTSSDAFLADRDDWQSVGSIDNIVMTKDGEIRGVLVDVGGFLGFGARTVMVDIEELYFVTEDADADSVDDFFVVIAMSQDQLEQLPEWDEEQLRVGFDAREHSQRDTAMGDTDSAAMERDRASGTTGDAVMGDGYTMLEGEERTVDRLMGADVYDANGENIGSVSDVVIGDDQRITDVIVDVGGFLGMGSHTVALPIEDAQIGWHDQDDDVRVQVSMTGEQLEDMPEYEG